MPQFDFIAFPVQIFWTTLFVYTMHLVYLYYFLPYTASVLKFRAKILAKNKQVKEVHCTKIWNKSFIIK